MGRLPIAFSTSTTARVDGKEMVVFAGCDYLGLAHHPRVIAAVEKGLKEFGVSSGASRETTGNTVAHDELERELADFLQVPAALLTPDGYMSNLIAAQGLAPAISTVLVDRECHPSIRDALAANAHDVFEFALADSAAAAALGRGTAEAPFAIFTDGVFPVLRTLAPLRAYLAELPPEGVLVVDDSHGTGVLGANGRGSVELAQLSDPRILITGTLSKALGCFGGFVAGSRANVERMRSMSRAYVGSTPVPPAIACAAITALRVVRTEPERRTRLFGHVEILRALFVELGVPIGDVALPVFTFRPGSSTASLELARTLADRGLLVPWVDYPDGQGKYFRIALRADHTDEQVRSLAGALREVLA